MKGRTCWKEALQEKTWFQRAASWTRASNVSLQQRCLGVPAGILPCEDCCQQVEGGDLSPLLRTGEGEPGVTCPVLGSPVQTDTWTYWKESSEGPQRWWRDKGISPMRKGWRSWDCSAWRTEGSGGIPSRYTNNWREDVKRTEPGPFQWCSVTGGEAMGTNWNTGGSVWTAVTLTLRVTEHWHMLLTERLCPGMLWSLYPWRHSKAVWTWSWATGSRRPWLSEQVRPDDVWRSLPTSAVLWFCVLEQGCSLWNFYV